MIAPPCQHERTNRFGKDRKGRQRFRCLDCGKVLTAPEPKLIGDMRIPLETAEMILNCLCEGTSVAAASRLTRTDPHTILDLLVLVGERCRLYMDTKIRAVLVDDVEIDEIWQFIGAKAKTAEARNLGPGVGDSYTFVATEATTKFVLCWHFGKRTQLHTNVFCNKLRDATAGRFAVATDGFEPYRTALPAYIGNRIDYGMVVKTFGNPTKDEIRKYSPARITGIRKEAICGEPNLRDTNTSYAERLNGSIRCFVKRMNRLTYCFSKKWANHEAMLGLFFMHYNYCRKHRTLKGRTPAMATGLANRPWTMRQLLENVATQ